MIESPCKTICKLQNEICIGCYRTRDEIASWITMSDVERVETLKRCQQRAYIVKFGLSSGDKPNVLGN